MSDDIPWEHQPRASWDLELMRQEIRERLYGSPEVRSDLVECELCSQFRPVGETRLFLARNGTIIETRDRAWEYKSGVRHVCPECITVLVGRPISHRFKEDDNDRGRCVHCGWSWSHPIHDQGVK